MNIIVLKWLRVRKILKELEVQFQSIQLQSQIYFIFGKYSIFIVTEGNKVT